MARRALKAINWAALAERVPETEKANLAAFKSKSDRYFQRMMANPEELPKIDWAYYKKCVVTPGLVDRFQKEYESISVAYPADNYTSEIESQKQEMAKKIEDFKQHSDNEIVKWQKKLDALNNMIPFAEMTLDDYKDAYPDRFMRTDKVTTWPHTEDTQEDLDEEDGPTKGNGH